MDLALPKVAEEFAAAAQRAVVGIGGVEAARRAELDPSTRTTQVKAVLDMLGVPDINPRADVEAAVVAGEMCRVAGRYVLPFPVVGYLMAGPDDGVPCVLASTPPLRCDHGDLFPQWRVHDLLGEVSLATPSGRRIGSRLAPFTTDLTRAGPTRPSGASDLTYLAALWAFYLLGVAEQAVELAIAHVKERVQFGRPLAAMQAVQFQLADATVAVDGLRELARFTIWRVASDPDHALADGLATRLHAVEVAQPVLRLAQQLHGASGLCDEYDISVLVRHAQPALRLPIDSDGMSEIVFRAVQAQGFESLFSQTAARVPDGNG
ncbi:MAG TPA: acyl-CoA dehydrogenase family protein [Acidimicrobiales bacterium]|nr:acyl-CoA dehydrogenase family protein [Acidimicrobiales bacterium]